MYRTHHTNLLNYKLITISLQVSIQHVRNKSVNERELKNWRTNTNVCFSLQIFVVSFIYCPAACLPLNSSQILLCTAAAAAAFISLSLVDITNAAYTQSGLHLHKQRKSNKNKCNTKQQRNQMKKSSNKTTKTMKNINCEYEMCILIIGKRIVCISVYESHYTHIIFFLFSLHFVTLQNLRRTLGK